MRVGSTVRPERLARLSDAPGRSRLGWCPARGRDRGPVHPERFRDVLLLRPGWRSLGPHEQRAPRHLGRRPLVDGSSAAVSGREAMSRSEEHTSELQSPCNLVCRLLLEKKKQKINNKEEKGKNEKKNKEKK